MYIWTDNTPKTADANHQQGRSPYLYVFKYINRTQKIQDIIIHSWIYKGYNHPLKLPEGENVNSNNFKPILYMGEA